MNLKIKSIKQISHKYSTYFFDLDGVLWRGDQKIKGAAQAMSFLRSQNKRIFFITNSSSRNKQMLKKRLNQFGVEANLDQIYPSDYITKLYVSSVHPNLKKLLVIGQKTLAEQIRTTGKEVWHLTEIQNADKLTNMSQIAQMLKHVDKSIDGVVFGYDFQINYIKLSLVSFHLQNGAKFIGTNPDKYTMIAGYKALGNGSMIKCIQQASGVTAEIAGKPNPFILEYLMKQYNLKKEQCLMIGDNLNTDIKFGINGGIDTLCVLTGVTTEEMALKSNISTYFSQYLV